MVYLYKLIKNIWYYVNFNKEFEIKMYNYNIKIMMNMWDNLKIIKEMAKDE